MVNVVLQWFDHFWQNWQTVLSEFERLVSDQYHIQLRFQVGQTEPYVNGQYLQ